VTTPRVVAIAAGSHIFGAAHAPALEALGAEVVGLYDLHRPGAEAVGQPRGWRVVDTLDELLALDADLAVIASPHPLHAELAERALAAGMHVLVEKPLAARPSEARRIVEAARAAGRVAAVALQHRFRAEVVAARSIVESGGIGDLQRAVVVATYPKRASYYAAAPWRGTWAGEGGGVLLNQGQHDLDTLVHVAGMPSRTSAIARTRVLPIETEDTVEAILSWDGGATGSVYVSSASSDPPNRIELHGSRGSLRILPGALDVTRHPEDFRDFSAAEGGAFDPFPRGETLTQVGGGGTHAEIYADLFAALAEGREPRATALDALPALELTAAIILSSSRDAPVSLPLDVAAYDEFLDRHRAGAAS
jgi:UDP-N-acetyl-2-amino-2-deoxyglucuronate dehydrogenase